jgi:hypothetical protein
MAKYKRNVRQGTCRLSVQKIITRLQIFDNQTHFEFHADVHIYRLLG